MLSLVLFMIFVRYVIDLVDYGLYKLKHNGSFCKAILPFSKKGFPLEKYYF